MSEELAPILNSNLALTDEKVNYIESEMLKMEQAPCPVTHRFGPNLYIREVFIPAGVFSIGHRQKTNHLNVMLKGKVLFVNSDGTKELLEAPLTFVAPPGRKIGFILEDMIWQNIYATDETNIEKLEEMFLDKTTGFLEHKRAEQLLLGFDNSEDISDYHKMLDELGITEQLVRSQSENEEDQIPMPLGSYKFQIGTSKIQGKGIFATADLLEDEVVGAARLNGFRTPLGRFTNHAKNPNARMVKYNNGDIYLVMNKAISGYRGGNLGDEITINYRQALSLATEKQLCQV
jgi:hypothetical protein